MPDLSRRRYCDHYFRLLSQSSQRCQSCSLVSFCSPNCISSHTPWLCESLRRLHQSSSSANSCSVSSLVLRREVSESVLVLESPNGRKRINRAVWGPLNQTIVSGGEDAVLRIWDAETGKLLKESDAEVGHKNTITSLTKAADDSHFITGSLDKMTAKLWDMRTLTLLKTYVSGVPVVLGGGKMHQLLQPLIIVLGSSRLSFMTRLETEEGSFIYFTFKT
ncbi:WD40-repeat-containing domain protein [Raphanus sativus]|nr:WD40-repeat-containing domain protein [Raphanus sativus]